MVETVFGFDFGIKRIGIAMGNTLTGQAQPLAVVKAIDNAARFAQIGALIAEWKPGPAGGRRAAATRTAPSTR